MKIKLLVTHPSKLSQHMLIHIPPFISSRTMCTSHIALILFGDVNMTFFFSHPRTGVFAFSYLSKLYPFFLLNHVPNNERGMSSRPLRSLPRCDSSRRTVVVHRLVAHEAQHLERHFKTQCLKTLCSISTFFSKRLLFVYLFI